MAEFLFEILSEEIPSRMQGRAADDLARLIREGLESSMLSYSRLDTFSSPRRLALVADGLPTTQPDVTEEYKGPRIDAPDTALQGFLRANGLASIEDAEIRELPKGKFYFATISHKGKSTADVLAEIVQNIFGSFPWPKSMRWGANESRWVRPIQNILCLFDGNIVPIKFNGIRSSAETAGHRFMYPDPIPIANFSDYTAKLQEACVMFDSADRRKAIIDGIQRLAANVGLSMPDDPGLLDEVTGLVEWPVPLLGTIDDIFMDIPQEVLSSAMRKHQKYFVLTTAAGAFSNRFALVANITSDDMGDAIVSGNERVLRARLSDAKFFWDQDRKVGLSGRFEELSGRIFQADLGTVMDKVERLELLAVKLSRFVEGADKTLVSKAARLCKADLSTGMVGEFPDLQGIMGRYYALEEGESDTVSNAIAEHYSPVGPGDRCPSKPESICIALADKIDTLVGFFGINKKPTGSRDPYALRRAALGVIRLILENGIKLELGSIFSDAYRSYKKPLKVDEVDVVETLMVFFADRLKAHLKETGVEHDYVSAVFAVGHDDDLVRLMSRVLALQEFLGTEDGSSLLIAYKRAANIVRIEEKKDGASFKGLELPENMEKPEANALVSELKTVDIAVNRAIEHGEFEASMSSLATLRKPLDLFFDRVKVNSDDPQERIANLSVLARIGSLMDRVVDFSKIEG